MASTSSTASATASSTAIPGCASRACDLRGPSEAIILIASLFCLFASPALPRQSKPTRILFIGNTYTYFNNLPEVFAKLAEAGHRGKVETTMVAPGGWRPKDHWQKGTAYGLPAGEKWDFAVLQEQSFARDIVPNWNRNLVLSRCGDNVAA
jgi:hypothetical protein